MRRLLVVAYYFPPSGGPGVQRLLKFVKYLPARGWQPTVLTVEAGAYPSLDPSLATDIPTNVAVHRTKALDPFGVYAKATGRAKAEVVTVGAVDQAPSLVERLARFARANVFVPDARVGWVPYATRAARRLLRDAEQAGQPFDAVLTSGPPHSAHLIGRVLHRKTGLPWVADFRDPWARHALADVLPMTAAAAAFDARIERSVLREATRLVTVSPTWQQHLADQAGRPAADVAVVHNGYDAEDFEELGPASADADVFTLTHVGSLYATRDPVALWDALADLRSDEAIPKLRVRLVGSVAGEVRASLQARGLYEVTEIEPYVPHDAAIAAMRSATALLLTIEPFVLDAGMITGKLYEYLAAGRPVVALGPAHGDAAAMLRDTGGGVLHARTDTAGLAATIRGHYDGWAAGTPRSGADTEAVAPFSREAQTGRLAAVLDALPCH
ncbi:MAG: glycosyltransferase [Bacteroidota bacterium]